MAIGGHANVGEQLRLQELLGDEVCCPVCYGVFDDPKCLPSCAHNVCRQCLEEVRESKYGRNKRFLECPVCRTRSDIPPNGITSFPTNSLLLRLIENTPGHQAEKAIRTAVTSTQGTVNRAREKLGELQDCISRLKSIKDLENNLKHKISEHARKLIEKVKVQESVLHAEVEQHLRKELLEPQVEDIFAELEVSIAKIKDFEQRAVTCIESAEDTLDEGNITKIIETEKEQVKYLSDINDGLQRYDNLSSKVDLRKIASFNLLFYQGSEKIDLGSLEVADGARFPQSETAEKSDTAREIDYSKSGQLVQRVESPILARIIRVAVCRATGDIAVCDSDQAVFVFDNRQAFKEWRRYYLKFGEPRDIALSKDNELIVLTNAENRVLFYSRQNGQVVHQSQHQETNAQSLEYITIDESGQLVITALVNNDSESGDYRHTLASAIIVCERNGNLVMELGRRYLSDDCGRAQSHLMNFYIADRTANAIFVFNQTCELISEVQGFLSIKSILVDYFTDNILVCFCNRNEICVYKRNKLSEDCVARISTKTRAPRLMELALNGKNIIVCFENRKFFDILTYVTYEGKDESCSPK